MVGNEGIVGVSLFMGGETTPSRAIVQSAGHAYRLKGQLLMDEFDRVGGRRAGGANPPKSGGEKRLSAWL